MNFAFAEDIKTSFYHDLITGLSANPKRVLSKYLYDSRGSDLFSQLTNQPEYYITRTEKKIIAENIEDIVDYIGGNPSIIDFGCGADNETKAVLDHIAMPSSYTPVEISRTRLEQVERDMSYKYPELYIEPLCADFTDPGLYAVLEGTADYTVLLPGSTLGNFRKEDRLALLKNISRLVGERGGVLIGVDLAKEPATILHAYDDKAGINSKFNLNILQRANRELGANFELDKFKYEARFDWQHNCVEMNLVSLDKQVVSINNVAFHFEKDEPINIACSHKYTLNDFCQLANDAGLDIIKTWMDDAGLYSVHYLKSLPA